MESSRYRIELNGAVQGIALRPFVCRLAGTLALSGYVQDSSGGLLIEVEGADDRLAQFIDRLGRERPTAALGAGKRVSRVATTGATDFVVAGSRAGAAHGTGMLSDLATCADCLREILDPADRRYGYAFTNCTACGPRFTIIERLPYDRQSTTMRRFQMCGACRAEYDAPANRRYHAQPNACPACGPSLSRSVDEIAAALRFGSIVALKGLGGFHLLCDATDPAVVARLRQRKARDARPFAVMMPSLAVAHEYCLVNEVEARTLASAAAPIVLLRPRPGSDLAPNVSNAAPLVGVLLPYSPLHHLLLRRHCTPVVATSGSVSGEPIAIDGDEARARLGPIADMVVTHDRPIVRPCDDSVVRVGAHGPSLLRRARGYAPLPIAVGVDLPPALAVGGHRENTIAIGLGRHAVVSQHLGDLDTAPARRAFEAAIEDLCRTYAFTPKWVIADRHADYASRKWAESSGLTVVSVQHHHAHVAACAADNLVSPPYLGVAWDGAGLGDGGEVWGGEFFAAGPSRLDRVAHLRPFPLLGGEAAAREGWRVALAMEWAVRGDAALEARADADTLAPMLRHAISAPPSTSVGRLFDAVAALTGICRRNRFDRQSALALEAAIDPGEHRLYPFGEGVAGDWEPLLDAIRRDLDRDTRPGTIAARFHLTLVDWICRVAAGLQAASVVLSGSVFENAFLVDRAVAALRAKHHRVYTHRRVPTNDGGLSLGQLVLASSVARG